MHSVVLFSTGAPLQDLYNMEKETCLLDIKLKKKWKTGVRKMMMTLKSKDF